MVTEMYSLPSLANKEIQEGVTFNDMTLCPIFWEIAPVYF